jgi:hypothetical protein
VENADGEQVGQLHAVGGACAAIFV